MRHSAILLSLLGVCLAAGTAHAQVKVRDHGTTPPPAASTWETSGWKLLGETTVWGKNTKDTIRVGRYEGRFDEIVIVVEGSDIEITKFVVHLDGKKKFEPKVTHYFRGDSRSRVIQLPGNDRRIDKIEVKYKNLNKRSSATVQVWGRDTRNPPPRERWSSTGWDKLGEAKVEGRRDRDSIKLSRRDGRFSKLMFQVEDGDVEIYDVTVEFWNGETFSPNLRLKFREGSRTGAIDLPGEQRFIKSIDFRFGAMSRDGRATVVVWGQPDTRGGGGHRGDRWDDKGWSLLAEMTVEGKADLDSIKVSRRDGKFKQLTLVVDADVTVNAIVVHHRSGKAQHYKIDQTFREGSRYRTIDLKDLERAVEQIDISWGTGSRRGRANVQVWAK